MLFRYPAALALTLAAAFALSQAAPAAGRRPHRPPTSHALVREPAAEAVFSAKALRRARIILQLKMLELRAERLERVRKALERNLPVERLLRLP